MYFSRMCLEDFFNNFTNVDICHFVNTSIFSLKKSWSENMYHSQWHVSGRNGGSDWNSTTFLSNPQVGSLGCFIKGLIFTRILLDGKWLPVLMFLAKALH